MKETELEYAEKLIKSYIGLGYDTAVWLSKKDVGNTLEALCCIEITECEFHNVEHLITYYNNILQILKDKS